MRQIQEDIVAKINPINHKHITFDLNAVFLLLLCFSVAVVLLLLLLWCLDTVILLLLLQRFLMLSYIAIRAIEDTVIMFYLILVLLYYTVRLFVFAEMFPVS